MAPHLPCSKPQTSQLFLDRCGLGPNALPCHCPSFPGLQPQGQNEHSPNLKASPGLPTSNTGFYHLGWSSLSLGRVGWTGRWEEHYGRWGSEPLEKSWTAVQDGSRLWQVLILQVLPGCETFFLEPKRDKGTRHTQTQSTHITSLFCLFCSHAM